MGWNSWDSYEFSLNESEFEKNAYFMSSNMSSHGWQYLVVDAGTIERIIIDIFNYAIVYDFSY